jgi:phosphoglycolate phosphatase
MTYRLIIFDFDGTLADTFPWMMGILDHLAEKYNYPRPNQDEINSFRYMDTRKLIKQSGISIWKINSISRYVMKRMADDIQKIPLFDGIADLLHRLVKDGTNLAVVSSNSKHNVRQVLGPEISALIQHWECGAPIFGKAHKFKHILHSSGIPADESMCIGDEIRDIEAAKKANIPFGAVSWGYTHVDSLIAQAPEMVFASVCDMAEKIAAPCAIGSAQNG